MPFKKTIARKPSAAGPEARRGRDGLFEAELKRIVSAARGEMKKCKKHEQEHRIEPLKALASDIEAGTHRDLLGRAFDAPCSCGGAQDLTEAAVNGCVRCCLGYLWQCGDDNPDDDEGNTALHLAALEHHPDCVELLAPFEHQFLNPAGEPAICLAPFSHGTYLQKRACIAFLAKYPEQINRTGLTELMTACMLGDVERAKKHLRQASQVGPDDCTALTYAAALGYDKLVELLAGKVPTIKDRRTTDLMYAAGAGSLSCVRKLASKEARKVDIFGETALVLALRNKHQDCALELAPLEAGVLDERNRPALNYAIKYSMYECAKRLLEDGREAALVPAQMRAAFKGDLKTMLAMRETWKERVWGSVTILHFALLGKQERAVRLLMREKETRELLVGQWYQKTYKSLDVKAATEYMRPIARYIPDDEKCQTQLDLLFGGMAELAQSLGPFCYLTPSHAVQGCLEERMREGNIEAFLRAARNAGCVFHASTGTRSKSENMTLLELGVEPKEALSALVSVSPVYSKQLELARKQIARAAFTGRRGRPACQEIPENRQFLTGERRKEVLFNRGVQLECEGVLWGSVQRGRRVEERNSSGSKEKLKRNRQAISWAWRFLAEAVTGTLEE